MLVTHLLENMGVPAGVAVAVGVPGLVVKVGLGGKERSARGGRGQRPPRDGH
jgi:hypothetical protein